MYEAIVTLIDNGDSRFDDPPRIEVYRIQFDSAGAMEHWLWLDHRGVLDWERLGVSDT